MSRASGRLPGRPAAPQCQIDAREIPVGWSTGYVPLGRSSPYQPPSQPFNSNGVQQVYELNASLPDFAFGLTANVVLPDDTNLQQVRAGYPTYPDHWESVQPCGGHTHSEIR